MNRPADWASLRRRARTQELARKALVVLMMPLTTLLVMWSALTADWVWEVIYAAMLFGMWLALGATPPLVKISDQDIPR